MALYAAVKVWDSLVRICHWLNALFVFLLLILGGLRYMEKVFGVQGSVIVDLHAVIGFLFSATLFVRILYLFSARGAAAWGDIVPHTKKQWLLVKATLGYYMGGFRGEPPLYLGHNPLAGIAYTGFFIIGALQALTGSAIYLLGGERGVAYASSGPLGHTWPPERLVTVHLAGAVAVALFIAAHLLALGLHDLVERRGLASSMISGYKFFSIEESERLGLRDGGRDDKGRGPA